MTATSYAIWISKNAKDAGFEVWASPRPDYSIPQTLEEGITKVKEFLASNDFLPGTGTWLCGFEAEREMVLGQMSAECVITWTNSEWANRVTADDLAREESRRVDDEAQAKKKLKDRPLTVSNRSLREQTFDASAKILQHTLGNMMFRTEGLHPISDSTIHIQLDGDNNELDISFWPILGAFNTNDPDKIDDKLCSALFHNGKIDGKRLSSVQLIRNVLYFNQSPL